MEGRDGRTERATGKKRHQAEREGNFCVSQEILTFGALLAGTLALRAAFPHFGETIGDLMRRMLAFPVQGTWNAENLTGWYGNGLHLMGSLLAPIVIPIMLAGVISCMVQTGPAFSWKTLQWRWSALNPVSNMRRLFRGSAALMNLLLALLKIGLILGVVYHVAWREVPVLPFLVHGSVAASILWLFQLVYRVVLTVVLLFLLLAILDWIYRKYQYERSLMMTKEEVREERKQQEPSPLVRKAQMRKMREFSLMHMMAAVPNASVVITNPTHVAVALEYDPDRMDAPVITAKGLRLVAERIKRIARENNVPIIERPAVARSLYKYGKVGQAIPGGFYEAVAEILAYLYRLGRGIRVA